jgi:hypothetical protein
MSSQLLLTLTGLLQAPQSLVVELSFTTPSSSSSSKKAATTSKVYVGWTGMPSSVASVAQQVRGAAARGDRIEMDPQFAAMLGLGLVEGTQVSRRQPSETRPVLLIPSFPCCRCLSSC